MYIDKNLYNQILNYDYPSYESGIVLGGINNQIAKLYFDCESKGETYYSPNTKIINNVIKGWSKENIDFLGLAHTHPCFQIKLSSVDKEYIKNILHAMPIENSQLYFPVVLPKKQMVSYLCKLENNQLQVKEDDINFI